MKRIPWLALIAALILGSLTAVCMSRTAARTGAPADWSRHTRGQPFVSQSVLASGPPMFSSYALAAYQSMVSKNTAEDFQVEATLPESGKLVLTPHYRASHATSALVLEVGSRPTGQLMQFDGESHPLSCTGELNVIQAGPVVAEVSRVGSGWSATVNGQQMSCATQDAPGQPAVTAGLRRVSIHKLGSAGTATAMPGAKAAAIGIGTGLAFLAVLILGARWSPTIANFTGVASTSGLLFLPIDGAQLAETMRLIGVAGDLLPLTISTAAALGTLAVGLSIRLAKTAPAYVAIAPCLGLAIIAAATLPVIGEMGWLYTIFAGLALGALVWVNVHPTRVPRYNLVALALAVVLIGSTEVMVRFTHVGSLWNAADSHHGAGSMNTLIEQFEGMASGVPSVYPSKGFPVALGPKIAPTRVACLGASSTGGAFQNDSLDEFYPARMSHMRPPNAEVVNQGVGGWTSFHIRKFLEGHADTLDAEVWTLYLGVNENLPTRMSFADLFDAWEAGNLNQGFSALDNIRLFQGLRLFSRGLQPGAGAGVSPEALKENLEAIAAMAHQRGTQVLLMSEGVRPDPRILWHYAAVMQDIADTHEHVAYLDTAAILDAVGDGAFIDSNHLTDLGHRTVAQALKDELSRLDWW
jgi:hypothetical protein